MAAQPLTLKQEMSTSVRESDTDSTVDSTREGPDSEQDVFVVSKEPVLAEFKYVEPRGPLSSVSNKLNKISIM